MHIPRIFLVPFLALALAGCAHRPITASTATAPTLEGDSAHPGQTKGWLDTRLYFGLGPVGHPDHGVSEADWREFLDHEVTPRFPDGLSVLDVYGQWQGKSPAGTTDQTKPERLRSKMLVIDYPDTAENRAKIEAIRAAWKRKTGDRSVLRVTEHADVSF